MLILCRSRVQACPRGMQEDVWRAVRWMVKSLPLVHSDAKHPEFKILHPYCAPDEKTFCSWNVGKQRACEVIVNLIYILIFSVFFFSHIPISFL